jgi:uncharacterized protein YacL
MFKSIINQFKDPELLMIIAGMVIGLILLRIFSNFLSRHRILKIGVIGVILITLVLGIFWFVDNRKDFYSNNVNTFVYGEVKNISSAVRKIELKVTRTNVKNYTGKPIVDSLVVINVDKNCKFIDKDAKEISFNDIGFYDTVQVYVKENKIEDTEKDTLSGVKLVLKNDFSK